MKKLYSTIMMLAMMVAALSLTACGGDDEDEIGGDGNSSDDEEYFEITINGEKYISSSWYGAVLVGMNKKNINGTEAVPYGGSSGIIRPSSNRSFMFFVLAGYAEGWESDNWQATAQPKPTGTYNVVVGDGDSYDDNVGMVISTSDASNYEVTSGNVKFTKVSKPNNRFQSRTEGIFNFTFYDKVHDEEYVCIGKFILEV